MTTVEHEERVEQRSSVKLTRNAKGDPQWEIKVVEGTDPDEVYRLGGVAISQHTALMRALVDPDYSHTASDAASTVPF